MSNLDLYLNFYSEYVENTMLLYPISYSFIDLNSFPISYNNIEEIPYYILAYMAFQQLNAYRMGNMKLFQKYNNQINVTIDKKWHQVSKILNTISIERLEQKQTSKLLKANKLDFISLEKVHKPINYMHKLFNSKLLLFPLHIMSNVINTTKDRPNVHTIHLLQTTKSYDSIFLINDFNLIARYYNRKLFVLNDILWISRYWDGNYINFMKIKTAQRDIMKKVTTNFSLVNINRIKQHSSTNIFSLRYLNKDMKEIQLQSLIKHIVLGSKNFKRYDMITASKDLKDIERINNLYMKKDYIPTFVNEIEIGATKDYKPLQFLNQLETVHQGKSIILVDDLVIGGRQEKKILISTNERLASIYRRWYFIPNDGPYDKMILPLDFPYNKHLPIAQGLTEHPFPNGADKGVNEIEVSQNIMGNVIDICKSLWVANCQLYTRYTPEQALKHFVNCLFDWLDKYVPDMIDELYEYYGLYYQLYPNNAPTPETYWRIYRWIRWYAEGIITNIAPFDKNELTGNDYIKYLIDDLIKYFNNHHGVYAPPGRKQFNKVKGIRHRWLINSNNEEV